MTSYKTDVKYFTREEIVVSVNDTGTITYLYVKKMDLVPSCVLHKIIIQNRKQI